MSINLKPLRLRRSLSSITTVSLFLLVGCGQLAAPPTPPAQAVASFGQRADLGRIYVCPMHPHIHSQQPGQCPICGMDLIARADPTSTASTPTSSVEVSAAVRQTLGIRTATVTRRDMRPVVKVPARVVADARGEVRLQSRVTGFVERLHVSAVGSRLRVGEIVAELYAPELLEAQEELLLGGDAADAAGERLRRLGIAETDIAAIRTAGRASHVLPLRAPAAGIVTAIPVREGSRVGRDEVIVAIGAFAGLRVEALLFPTQRDWLGNDIEARFSLPGVPGREWLGRDPEWLSVIDPITKTLGLRFRIEDVDALAIGTWLDAELLGAIREQVLLVPAEAVIRTAAGDRVLLEREEGHFAPVPVVVGARLGDELEILEGLDEGARIVVSGQFLIDSEAMLQSALSRLSVGVAGHDHD